MLNVPAFLNTISTRTFALPVAIFYVTEGCNLQCQTCSYRDRLPGELSLEEISSLARGLREKGLRRIVYSGGEPLFRKDFPEICKIFARERIAQSLLTNGLLLNRRYGEIKEFLSEIIVSVDGVDSATHNHIRGVDSLETITAGIHRVLADSKRPIVSVRTVLQKCNFRQLPAFVEFAKSLQIDSISFLAVDVLSASFGRSRRGSVAPDVSLLLNAEETAEFRQLVLHVIAEYKGEFEHHLIAESPVKLLHIVQYFEALSGRTTFPPNRCNAPMVSAVITSTGNIQPCFFLPPHGNIRETPLPELFNSTSLRSTRDAVREGTLERCKTCVCTMYKHPVKALMDKF